MRKQAAQPSGVQIQMKVFCLEEAERHGTTFNAIHNRIKRGRYPGLVVIRINARVVFVDPTQARYVDGHKRLPELKELTGRARHTQYMRLRRNGKWKL